MDGSPVETAQRRVFVSYATADRKQALSLSKALERRGTDCWISTRDVAPGENYQEAIVHALRTAHALVLVFSEAANNSDEIKKELSLASRFHVPVMALRIEDVEPSDAFAYELSTRQWIDAFDGWDRSIDALARRIADLPDSSGLRVPATRARRGGNRTLARHWKFAAAGALLLLLAGGAAWWFLRPAPAAAHSMMVRLAGFQRLSPDLPPALPAAVRDEITAAFGDQGMVGVSTASAPDPGSAPAYALGGTIRRDGDQIRVITRLMNERSGATLWSLSSNYDAAELARVPRRIAVDAARMARCGLFAASTYRKPLPDPVFADYLQYCQSAAVFQTAPEKALDSARKVVAVAPDFSWGWSAVTLAAAQSQWAVGPGERRNEVRRIGLQAADKALSLDRANSEALALKGMLVDPNDHVAQERLLRQAIAARPLDCGCEHFLYGLMLENVGRYEDAAQEFRRAVDMMALDDSSQFTLGDALIVIGRADEAKPHFDAMIDLSRGADASDFIAVIEGPETGNYPAAVKALEGPKLDLPETQRSAILAAFRALQSGDNSAKARAVQMLIALPQDQKDPWTAKLLAALGAHHEALELIAGAPSSRFDWASTLWYPSMRTALSDSMLPAVLEKFALIKYWRATGTRPDVCSGKNPPPFCRTI